MLKKIKQLAAVFMALALVLGTGMLFRGNSFLMTEAKAAENLEGPLDEIESGKAYQYTIHVYSGKEGYFSSNGSTEKSVTVKAGEPASISIGDLVVTDPDQYYPRGMKLAGHDNDEIDGVAVKYYQGFSTGSLDQDYSFSVAYGIKGGMVEYYVDYVEVDANGNVVRNLLDRETYYGMVDDKPVVSYQYVQGYRPNAYTAGKTLTDDPDDNVFTFTYTPLAQPAAATTTTTTTTTTTATTAGTTNAGTAGTTGTTNAGTTGTTGTTNAGTTGTTGTANTGTTETNNAAAGAAGTAQNANVTAGTAQNANAAAGTAQNANTTANDNAAVNETANTAAGAEAANAAPQNTEPVEYIDLDDEQVPLAGVDNEKQDSEEADGSEESVEDPAEEAVEEEARLIRNPLIWVIAGVAAVVVIAVIAYSAGRRKANPGDEDDSDLE